MGLVNPTQSSAGDTIDAADINNPVNQLAAVVNGNIDTNNIAANGVGTSQLANASVTDAKLQARFAEFLSDFIYSGGAVAQSAGLTGTFSNIVYYISGIRYTATSVANKTYTASKDTYVDINTSGTVTYTEVANGAASPALTASNVRVAKVVTSGAAITSVAQVGSDSLNNLIYNDDANRQNAYRSYTPTLTNLSGGSMVANYQQIGKTVCVFFKYVLAGAGVTGQIRVTLPVVASSKYTVTANSNSSLGTVWFNDVLVANYVGPVLISSSTGTGAVDPYVLQTASTYAGVVGTSSTIPFTWASGDTINFQIEYEAA